MAYGVHSMYLTISQIQASNAESLKYVHGWDLDCFG